MKAYLREVNRATKRCEREIPPGISESYLGGGSSHWKYQGLKVPTQRGLVRRGYTFYELPEERILKVWSFIWKSADIFEVGSQALIYYYEKKRIENAAKNWSVQKGWSARIDNWAHGDALCAIYAHALEQDRRLVLPTLKGWNVGSSPWLRRLSIVSLLYYAQARQRVLPFPTLKRMVAQQLDFDHYYVQKAVGWTLREMGHVYPKQTLEFLNTHCTRLSAAAFASATEKLSAAKKSRLKEARVQARRATRRRHR